MNIINRVQLTGNLGSKPEVKTFESGDKIARFSLATHENYTNRKGETATDTQWHNVVLKGRLVEKSESLDKGSFVSVEGRLNHRAFVDKDGNKKHVTEIIATDIVIHQKNN